jgi:hypothetical protein
MFTSLQHQSLTFAVMAADGAGDAPVAGADASLRNDVNAGERMAAGQLAGN